MHDEKRQRSIERARSWRAANPDRQKLAEERYRRENPRKRAESCRKWRQAHPERSRDAQRRYSERHPERLKEIRRRCRLKRQFGISVEHYEEMLAAQGGVCAICHRAERNSKRKYLTVDHCHASERVRGLLCANCNTAIGLIEDRPELAIAAAEYLRR